MLVQRSRILDYARLDQAVVVLRLCGSHTLH